MDGDAALIGRVEGWIGDAQRQAAKAFGDFDADAVHKGRVASRRASTALKVLAPLVSRKPRKGAEKVLKKLRHRLGKHRDLDVALGHLSQLAAEERHSHAAGLLHDALEGEREALRGGESKKVPTAKAWGELRAELEEAGGGFQPLVAAAVHAAADDFERLAMSGHDPHPLRLAGKTLRYTLELADEGSPGLKEMKRIQDSLGAWHDFAVLAEWCLRHVRRAALLVKDSGEARSMLRLADDLLGLAEGHLAEFKVAWGENGARMLRQVREAHPLAADAGVGDGAGVLRAEGDRKAPVHAYSADGISRMPEAGEVDGAAGVDPETDGQADSPDPPAGAAEIPASELG